MSRFATIVSFAAIVLDASAASAQPPLGSAQGFAVLGSSIVTNTGATIVTGNVGVSPSIAITGFPPGIVVGTIHAGDTVAAQARADAGIASLAIAAMTCGTQLTGQDLGAVGPLAPGVYCFNTSAQLTGTLRLTGTGPWIFQVGSTLTTAAGAAVVLDPGTACRGANVYWQVGTSATIGVGTSFAGTMIAGASATVMTGASVSGRVLALNAAVTLDANPISVCGAPPVNQAPVAAAGPDQTVFVGSTVTLDGSGSNDADGNALTFSWTLTERPAGSAATLANPLAMAPSFAVDAPGIYVLQLTVNDGTVDSTPDTVTISTTNSAPVANAGPGQTAFVGTAVTLDGSGSHDADGDGLTYSWAFTSGPAGSAAILSDPAAIAPGFTIDVPGTYVVELVVHDGVSASAPDTVTISTTNSAPVAGAGPDQTVFVGTGVTLDGQGSHDADGHALTFRWALTSRPTGSTAALSDPAAVSPTFTADRPGQYVAQLVVHDGTVDSAPDTVTISTTNSAPIADAGPAQTVFVGTAVTPNGSGSSDVDGDALTFRWAFTARPAASAATLANPTAVAPSFTVDAPGTYVLQLTVNDGTVDGAPDTVTITTMNSKPVANTGADQTVTAGDFVALDGSASSDADGELLTYRWAILARPEGSTAALSDPTAAQPTFTADLSGTYLAQLIVNDGHVDSEPDTATISTINSQPVANAGADRNVTAGDLVTLDGTASADADGELLTFRWAILSRPAGSTAALSDSTASQPTFTADLGGTYLVQLIVNDGHVDSGPDTAAISSVPATVPNAAPMANAGPDQTRLAGQTATLDGSASSDDGLPQPLSYAWVSNTGFSATGPGATVSLPVGTHVFTLTVSDGQFSATDTVTITVAASAPSPLGSAQGFAVLAAAIVSNIGPTVVTGDVGVSPATAITGFPPGTVVGTIHAADAVAAQAHIDAGIAYTQFAGLVCDTHLTGQDLNAVGPLAPGVYCFDTSAQLTGTLSLIGAGPWTFQIGSTLTTASNAVVMVNGSTACGAANVFWQVGTSATIGTFTQFTGTIVAGASVTVMTGASVSGRVLALGAAVTLDSNAISVCDAAIPGNQAPVAVAGPDQVVPAPSVVTLDGSASTDDGQLQPLSYSWVSNTGVSANGPVATVSLPLGIHVFTLTVNDGEFAATDAVTIDVRDVTAPAILIASPGADAVYALDQTVLASYACTDASPMASCMGTAASGAPIDTASTGAKTFCVTAVDGAANTWTQCVSYSVLEPPAITVTSPIEPIYELGALRFAEYSCGDAVTCTGEVASGSALDTSTPGLKSFTITATDAASNTTTQLVSYTVSLGTCAMQFAGLTAWLPGDGTAIERLSGTPGIWSGVETYAAGKVGPGFSVGSGNHVSLPFQQAGPFTLQAWVRASDRLLPESTGVLSTGGSAQRATSVQIDLDGSGNYRLNAGDGAVSWLIGPALDFFQHVALTFDGATLAAYLNGQPVQSAPWAGSPDLGFHVLNLGIDRDGLRPFTGLVDEVQVFNRALSAGEVAETFQAGASGLCDSAPAAGESPLGSAESFAVLGAASVTNIGATTVTGDLGIQEPATTAFTGFPPGVLIGTIHHADSIAAQAQADARIAYGQLKGLTCDTHLTGQDLGAASPLAPGVYCFDTSAHLTGTLSLTGTGPWLFQIGSTLTAADNAAVVFDAGSTCPGANVFWQVGSSATLGAGTNFAGTILALTSVTVQTGAHVSGRVLAINGAVTLDSSDISVCAPPPANQSPVANAGLDQVVPFPSIVTLDGSASSDDGQLQPLSYSWASDTGVSANGPVATVSLPLGIHVFTLTVNDGEFAVTDAVTIDVRDVTAPEILIASPGADAAYALDQTVLASYACTDASSLASCTGTVASGAPIDTWSAGSKTFCVTAVDGAANAWTQCVSYSVLEPPTITVTSPIEPIYELGSLLVAEYVCANAETCTGDVESGGALDTSTPGLKSFTITATDTAGNTTTQLVTYTVSLGTCVMPFAGLTAWLPGDGAAIERLSGTPGIWTGVETYAAGKVGQGFSVGNGNHVSLPFQQVGPFTVQAWIRATDRLLPEFTGVLSTGGSTESATSVQIDLDGAGNYRLNAGDGAVSWLIGPALDFFQHVAVTFDGSTLTAYLNGQVVQSDVWAGSTALGFHVLNVGIDRDGLHPFTGLVDEVQVFNVALTADAVAQTFQAGASGLCDNRPPVAVAMASPNPAEATGPDGAIVSLDGTGSSDPDLDTLTCTWHEGATLLGTGCLLSTPLAIGSHAITLTVDDGQGETATSDVVVDVRDTTGPAFTVPAVVSAEATGPQGAIVFYTASAIDLVSGAAAITCAPAAGSAFAIGITAVTCSAVDATGTGSSVVFNVIVSDTIAPVIQITSSADAVLSASTLAVVVQASDVVGVASVTVNGIEATRTAGRWVATVPVALPVAPGSVLRFDVRATDTAGNVGTATLLVDNDGISAALDRNRLAGADESGVYSNDFVRGTTAGTLMRNGWTVRLASAPTPNGVRATISGSGGIARVSACTGAAKEVRLDVIGETADITCAATTGTITVKAISAVMQIELREQLATGAWQQFNLRTGQSMSVGSPATASLSNSEPIHVDLIEIDETGSETLVGAYQLLPGASVDVAASPRARGRNGEVRFKVLRGSASVTVGGKVRKLKAGQGTTMAIERLRK